MDIQPSEFPFTPLSTHPIGSGPYNITKIIRDQESGKIIRYELEKKENYYKDDIFVDKIKIHFFDNYEDYQKSLLFTDKKAIKNIASVDFNLISNISSSKSYLEPEVKKIKTPKVFGLFMGKNYNNNLSKKSLRKAISQIINKKNITQNILNNYAVELDSIFPHLEEKERVIVNLDDNKNTSLELLKNSDFKLNDQGILINKKSKKPIELTISTLKNEEFKKVAESIKKDLSKIGIKINIILYEENKLINEVIRNRDFEILLYGYQLDIEPDPYYLFHSSQIQDPGINIASISNKKIDQLLADLRKNLELTERHHKEKELNKLILEDYSFIPLYNPYFIYIIDGRIKNFQKNILNTPEERFADIDK
jgi:ABC-type transport system substrate-binding protein